MPPRNAIMLLISWAGFCFLETSGVFMALLMIHKVSPSVKGLLLSIIYLENY